MHSDEPQRNALRFLRRHLHSQEPFTKDQFGEATDWTGSTLKTYWSKQYLPLLVEVPGTDQFRVSEAFRPFISWKKFQRHVTQNRPVAADYTPLVYGSVVIYEFFMPLTNETALRTTLDALFFKDTIIPKLRTIDPAELINSSRSGESGGGRRAILRARHDLD